MEKKRKINTGVFVCFLDCSESDQVRRLVVACRMFWDLKVVLIHA